MAGDSKILTVSYGAFSCTLEGFDDPFTTMKAIAEYYREVAATDRYFGAQPLRTDSQQLETVASGTSDGEITAEIGAENIVLRRTDEPFVTFDAPTDDETDIAIGEEDMPIGSSLSERLDRIRAAVEPQDDTYEVTGPLTLESDAIVLSATDMVEDAEEQISDEETLELSQDDEIEEALDAAADSEDLIAEFEDELEAAPIPEAADQDATVEETHADLGEDADAPADATSDDDSSIEDLLASLRNARQPAAVAASGTVVRMWREDQNDDAVSEDDEVETFADLLRRDLGTSSQEDDAEEDMAQQLTALATEEEARIEATEDGPAPLVLSSSDAVQADLDGAPEAAPFLLSDSFTVEPEKTVADAEPVSVPTEKPTHVEFRSSDADMGRIMDVTDREMGKNETTRRLNAIQHLKAAVTAARAEMARTGKGLMEKGDRSGAYREDLAKVVRNRTEDTATARPTPAKVVSQMKSDPETAPLRLEPTPRPKPFAIETKEAEPVATAAQTSMTIRPRRILSHGTDNRAAVATVADHDADLSFAEFAQSVGADGLLDMIEAATAYSNYVEGRETVTRPQIMRLATEALETDTPMEERLRSFGQLLRQGKIKKVSRGQFVVDDSTRFKIDQAAGM